MKVIFEFFRKMCLGAVVLGLPAFSLSCSKAVEVISPGPEAAKEGLSFTIVLEEPDNGMDTKSLLPSSIESKVTSVCFAVYQDGKIVDREYYGSTSGLQLIVERGKAFNVYVVGNMGDVRSQFPTSEADVAGFQYRIPSYDSVSELGLPLYGSAEYAANVTSLGTVKLWRLMAKVTANISCSWSGAQISSVKVFNLNGALTPFDATNGSRALSASDILSVQEYSAGTSASSGSFVFYVPENRQGNISGIINSSSKSPDYNSTVSSRQGYLTYIETRVEGTGDYSGHINYRSYLGSNATQNFDIIGNKRYVWNLSYNEDGIQTSNWKHDNYLSWNEYRYSLSRSSMTLDVGGSSTFQVYRYTDVYTGGSKTSTGTTPEVLPISAYSFVSLATGTASVAANGTNAVAVTGVAQGSTTVRVTVSSDGSVLNLPVTVNDVYSITISPTSASIMTGNTHTFTATLKRNGMTVTGLSATDFTWMSSDPSKATVSTGGVITGVAEGTVTVTVSYTPSGSSSVSASATVTVVKNDGGGIDTGWDEGSDIEL